MSDPAEPPASAAGRLFIGFLACCVLASTPARADSFLPVYQSGSGVFETDLSIGNEQDDDYLFFQPFRIDLDGAGNIFVFDFKLRTIREYDPEGRHLRTFGREGEGPGEIGRSLVDMAVTPDGRVVVADYENKRITTFDAEGRYAGDVKFESMVPTIRATPDGGFLVYTMDPSFPDFSRYSLRLAKYDASFAHVADVDSQRVVLMEMRSSGGTMRSVSIPYVDQFTWAMRPGGGVVVSEPGDYHLRVLTPRLETVAEITRDVDRVPVTKSDRDRYVGDMDEGFKDMARESKFPKDKPYVSDILVDHEGYILVCRYDEDDSNTHYDVFSPDGGFVGAVTLPKFRKFKVIRDGFVYGVETFEEELPQVRRWRLVPGDAATTERKNP